MYTCNGNKFPKEASITALNGSKTIVFSLSAVYHITKVMMNMKKIEIKKFITIVLSIVLSFSIIAGLVLWFVINKQPEQMNSQAKVNQNKNDTNNQTVVNNADGTDAVSSDNNDVNNQIQGGINIKNINAMVKIQKYSLLTNGLYEPTKINKFIVKNIEQFLPVNCTKIDYKTDDIDKDGINEVAMMYETSNQNDRYLMIVTLRWKDGVFYKDVDTELRKNDYNFNTNEIVVGDIITGGNPEFIFIQKDPQGLKPSRAKIIIMTSREFSDFDTIDSSYELEFKDYDSDGQLELYTSLIAVDGNKHMSWKKWDGKDFSEYDSKIEPIVVEGNY